MGPLFSPRLRRTFSFAAGLAPAILLISSQLALAQFTQQGAKLVGTGASGAAQQGWSVALSGDGTTTIVGGPTDNLDLSCGCGAGAAWVFTRSGGVWTPQGSKLVGMGASGPASQGQSVALSADGNTAIVGGNSDNSYAGATWVWIRINGVWTQQGDKLVGNGATGNAAQGFSVALSADGNTAIVGGPNDSNALGAAWVFTRSGGAWTQQGDKLVGSGAMSFPQQGWSVALSGDGNTAIVGGLGDDSFTGAAWVFTRSGGIWTQQGSKLVGNGATGNAAQGRSVALSSDGDTAMLGGPADSSGAGAVWVFTRSGGAWSQQGGKLVGTGATGNAAQGWSVALSANGNTATVGGQADDSNAGATWVFTRSGGMWTQQGSTLVGTGATGNAEQGFSVALSADGNTAMVGGPSDDSSAGAAWAFVGAPVPFGSFTAKLTISSFKPGFALSSRFTLGATSDGINPLAETVTLAINSFMMTIPPFSFSSCGAGCYFYNGIINGLSVKATITRAGPNTYTFQASANPNLIRTKDPATVMLAIGNDAGTTKVRF